MRRALAYATDKGEIISVMRHWMAGHGLTLIPDSSGAWFNDSLQDYTYDSNLANEMLDEAGYLDRDGVGVREGSSGEGSNGEVLVLRMNWPIRQFHTIQIEHI